MVSIVASLTFKKTLSSYYGFECLVLKKCPIVVLNTLQSSSCFALCLKDVGCNWLKKCHFSFRLPTTFDFFYQKNCNLNLFICILQIMI